LVGLVAGEVAGFAFMFVVGLEFMLVVGAFVAGVLTGAGVEAGVDTTTGVAFAGLFAALLLVVVSPPQAIPKALRVKKVESAIIFFMSI
jgi:hypothetical protein